MPGPIMPGPIMPGLVKRSLALSGHRTSVALEPDFWAALEGEAAAAGRSLAALVAAVDAARGPETPLASALRVHALRRAQAAGRAGLPGEGLSR